MAITDARCPLSMLACVLRRMLVSDGDEYRASARDCLCKAEKASYPEDKQVWMDMAETWLEMIPAPERTPEEMFEKAVREQATQQDPSNTRH